MDEEKLEGRKESFQDLRHTPVEEGAPRNVEEPSKEVAMVEDPRSFDFDLDPRIPLPMEKAGPAEDTISILVDNDNSDEILKIRLQLNAERRKALTEFLLKNLDVFT